MVVPTNVTVHLSLVQPEPAALHDMPNGGTRYDFSIFLNSSSQSHRWLWGL